mmetsp:Transcript_9083/g.27205  ORF Transcript_9083/g.27205 Transcript_9083/m.27205 type:complete len:137 (-) Transcript_9083:1046-1456(-)
MHYRRDHPDYHEKNQRCARGFLLTYAAFSKDEFTIDTIIRLRANLNSLSRSRRYNVVYMVWGFEKHPRPADARRDRHVHIVVYFNTPLKINNRRTSDVFDLEAEVGTLERPARAGVPRDGTLRTPHVLGAHASPRD